LGKKEASLSRTGSEADSLLDLYGGRESSNRSAISVMEDGKGDKKQLHHKLSSEDPSSAYWIHRDKLAKIESEELQQLGIHIPPTALAGPSPSKRGRGRTRSRESHGTAPNGSIDHGDNNNTNRHWSPNDDDKRPWISSAAIDKSLEEQDNSGAAIFDDPRLPEEIAADPYEEGSPSPTAYRMPVLRKSNSKIPILSSSRLASSPAQPDRESPLQRSRNNTVNGGEDQATSEAASRALDTQESAPAAETTPPQTGRRSTDHAESSPTTGKTTAKAGAAAAARKTTTTPAVRKPNATAQKSKLPAATNNTTNQRPTTRSGDRPQTAANPPEGDPPWLATMYKPDPRLPPDQQILPTHARRLAQEQWEREGKIPDTYSRDFAPLSIRAHENPPAVAVEPEKDPKSPSMDLKPPASDPRKTPDGRPSTSGSGYKTVPTIQPSVSTTISARQPRPMAVEDSPRPKEKGCGCCVVM
jgi:hypothetical protein